jgi:hypothetical protein
MIIANLEIKIAKYVSDVIKISNLGRQDVIPIRLGVGANLKYDDDHSVLCPNINPKFNPTTDKWTGWSLALNGTILCIQSVGSMFNARDLFKLMLFPIPIAKPRPDWLSITCPR